MTFRLGTGKSLTFFYNVRGETHAWRSLCHRIDRAQDTYKRIRIKYTSCVQVVPGGLDYLLDEQPFPRPCYSTFLPAYQTMPNQMRHHVGRRFPPQLAYQTMPNQTRDHHLPHRTPQLPAYQTMPSQSRLRLKQENAFPISNQ